MSPNNLNSKVSRAAPARLRPVGHPPFQKALVDLGFRGWGVKGFRV